MRPKVKRLVAVGSVFGCWTVVGLGDGKRVSCRCQCGKERSVAVGNLVRGQSSSCGCVGLHVGDPRVVVTEEDFKAIRAAAGDVDLKAIPGFPGYIVSSVGVVYSVRRWKREPRVPFRALKFMRHSGGYPQVNLRGQKKSGVRTVHRLVAEAFLVRPARARMVRHLDGDPDNNDVTNLAWGTQVDNHADSVRHGTVAVGEKNGHAKLTRLDVDRIRKLRMGGVPSPIIATAFGLSVASVNDACGRRSWKCVE